MPARDLWLVLLICAAWALNFLASAKALTHFPALLFTAMRMGLVLLCLLPWLRPPPPGQWSRMLAVALLTNVVHFGLNFSALQLAGDISSNAIVLQSYIPMAALLAWWLLGERLRWRSSLAIAIAFAGVLVLGFDPVVLDAPLALVLCLLSALTLAWGLVLMRQLAGVRAFQLQAWSALLGAPLLFGASLLLDAPPGPFVQHAEGIHWLGVVYSALGASLVGHGVLYVLVQRHPVAQITPYLLLTPVLAVALGVLVWGDRPGSRLWLGGAMVLVGVLVVALRQRARSLPVSEAPEI